MTRKKYYKFLDEYNTLAEQKKYNQIYFDENRFEFIKNKLQQHLMSKNRMIEYMSVDCAINRKYAQASICMSDSARLSNLYNKIDAEDILSKDDYERTYFYEMYFGFLTKYQLIFGLLICILFLLIFIVR